MNKRTFNSVYAQWMERKRLTVKQSSLFTYKVIAEKHLVPFFGGVTAVDIARVQEFINMKVKSGLSRNTVRGMLRLLNMIVSYGRQEGLACNADLSCLMLSGAEWHEPGVLTVAEQRRMMTYLMRNMSFRNIGLYLCLCTGMRIGEICALKWSDINLEAHSLRVSRTIQRIYRGRTDLPRTQLHTGLPKTYCSMRDLPLSADLVRLLRPVIAASDINHFVLTNSLAPLEPHQYRRYYLTLMQRAGLPRLKFHCLRHTFATRCIESGCDYKTVSALLGHASVATTLNLYVHPDMEQKRRCVNRMLRCVRQ